MFAASGCLVADPPEYQPPVQTPPMLDQFQAVPLVQEVLPRRSGESISFNVPVRSEDAGDDLRGAFYLDFGSDTENHLFNVGAEASTLDDDTRAFEFNWTVAGVARGTCHTLSLLVSHRETFVDIGPRPGPRDSNDQDLAMWWLNVDPDETDPNSLDHCPAVSETGM